MSKKKKAGTAMSAAGKKLVALYDVEELKRTAAGRWVEILAAAGVPSGCLDGRHHPCPKCGGRDRFRLIDEDAGALFCNHCFDKNNGDGIAAAQWWLECDFIEAVNRIGEYLRLPRRHNGTHVASVSLDPLVVIARQKGVSPESFTAYGAKSVPPNQITFPAYGPDGKQCTWFTIASSGNEKTRKGLFAKGKPAGLFFPHEFGEVRLPRPGETWCLVEGVKDAAALHGLGYLACGMNTHHLHPKFNLLFRGVNIIAIPDRDKAGTDGITKTSASLEGCASLFKTAILPAEYSETKGPDVRDVLRMKDGECLLRKAIEDATVAHTQCEGNTEPREYAPFPTELLPSPVRDYIEAAATSICCDAAYVALPLLATLAGAIGTTRRIRLKKGWSEPSVIWCATVGDSGSRKSPGWEAGTEFLEHIQRDAHAEWKSNRDEWLNRSKEDQRDSPEPREARYTTQDVTVEGLAALLEDNPRGLTLVRDELSGWLASFGQYKHSGGADVASWLSIHSAKSIRVDRKTGDKRTRYVPSAAVSVAGTIQPGALARAIQGRGENEHVENGLLARLLLAWPPYTPKRWTEATIADRLRDEMKALFGCLVELEHDGEASDDFQPVMLDLTPKALRTFQAFVNDHGKEQAGLPAPLKAAWSKLEGYAARLALVVHLVREASGDAGKVVDAESIEAGIELARWFAEEAARIYAALGTAEDSPEARAERSRQRLVEWIKRRGGRVSVRDVQAGHRQYKTADEAERALRELAAAGLGEMRLIQPSRGGRPSLTFSLFVDGLGAPSTLSTSTKPPETRETASFVDVDNVDARESVYKTRSVVAPHVDADSDDWGEV